MLILDLKRNGMTLNLISVRIHILPVLDSEEIYLNLIEIKFTCLIDSFQRHQFEHNDTRLSTMSVYQNKQ